MTNLRDLSRLISRLERWIEKRNARGLETHALDDAVTALKEYHAVLAAEREAAA